MKRLLFLSGKGGTGKTTTAAAFAYFSGAKALADCDVDAPNLHLVTQLTTEPAVSDFIGAEKAVVDPSRCIGCGLCAEKCRFDAIAPDGNYYKVNEYACEGCGVCTYVCPQQAVSMQTDVAGQKQLYQESEQTFSTARLKMGRGNSGKLVTEVKLALLRNAPECQLALIDGSPGIGCPVIASVSGVDMVLVVAEASKSGISDLQRLLKTAETFRVPLAVCVNKWDVSPAHTKEIQAYCAAQNIPFVGKIPYDRQAGKAINHGQSLASCPGAAADALYQVYCRTMEQMGLPAAERPAHIFAETADTCRNG